MTEKMNEHVGMVIKRKDELLFIKRSLTSKSLPGIWAFPSGTIEEGESPIQTAMREVKEELNLNVISAEVLSKVKFGRPDIKLTFVLCKVEQYEMKVDVSEIAEVDFMKLDDFFNKFKDEEIGHGLQMIRKDRSLLKNKI